MASIYKRGDTWWISYYVGEEQTRKSLKTTQKSIAMREKVALEAELLDPSRRVPDEKNTPVDVFWEAYSVYAQSHQRKPTISIQAIHWNQLMEFTGARRLADIKRRDVEAFKAARLQQGSAPQSINNALRDIQAIYNKAIKLGHFTGINPAIGVERFKISRHMPTFHTEEELNRLLEAAEKNGQHAAWVVLLGGWAGLRRAEIVNARWEWFQWDNIKPVLHVKAFDGFELKDSEDRTIPMPKRIWEAFYPYRKKSGFVFESGHASCGRHRYRFEPRRVLLTSLRDAELTTESPFQRLRHTFGSLHAQAGTSLFKVAKWMGHSSVTVTERHYAGLQAYDKEIDVF